MAIVTRTTNPLPLQDLEPHRFEDLVRQLAYEFRDWQKLEATGRAGSDDGFDARGLERVPSTAAPVRDDRDDDEQAEPAPATRLWLIQCKREKAIGPTKLRKYVEAFGDEPLYGVVLAAACDFSKKTRDEFDAVCRERGYSEAHLWGKGEIEDALFQPKNDHLLFAYFGVSLALRRRSLQTGLRAVGALKKTLRRVLADQHMLVLRQSTSEYPDLPQLIKPTWTVVWNSDCTIAHDGLYVDFRHYRAYAGDDGKSWDAANQLGMHRDAYHMRDWGADDKHPLDAEADSIWHGLESKNQGWLHLSGRIHYERILAIDEVGDQYRTCPHVFVDPFNNNLFDAFARFVKPNDSHRDRLACDEANRIKIFPDTMRRT